ncbi:MAG: methyltransferase domain-containing protein, partial [Deltaproteobacteria bacterium]|nr:methyltransferase domain-containing protein [Deltaproteobacteria bacterium]
MKKILLEMLICPTCLPDEHRLNDNIIQEEGEDIITGSLTCNQCKKHYLIRDGIVFLNPISLKNKEKADSKYETAPVLSSYLWSHYGDILHESKTSVAYSEWADLMHKRSGVAIDAGSALGRFSFEMSRKSDFVVGIDNSLPFIKASRELMLKRRMKIKLKQEGVLSSEETLYLPEAWNSDKVEFIVGDAQALPFKSETFSSLASLNLVDKVPLPMQHLKEMNRVAKEKEAQFIISDPFSWSKDVADEKDWLGGTDSGPYSGRGIDNIIALLKGDKNGFS